MNTTSILRTATLPIAAAIALAAGAGTAQSQTIIDQAKAMAGNVTPGDAPGFPVTLSVPGHYVLTSNLVVPAYTNGIHITAANVTLNLNGFTVRGQVICNVGPAGPNCIGPTNGHGTGIVVVDEGVVIRNGHVWGFPGHGVAMRSGIIEDVQVSSNDGTGISAAGAGEDRPARLSGVRVTLNRGHGIFTRQALIERAVLSHNLLGVSGYGMVIVDSLVTKNAQHGLSDISNGSATNLPPAIKGTVMHSNGGPSISGTAHSLGGNRIDGVAF